MGMFMKPGSGSCFEAQSLPSLLRCYPRSFTFYLGNPFPLIPAFLI